MTQNSDKKSVAIDLKIRRAEALKPDRQRRCAGRKFQTGTAGKLGIGYEDLKDDHPTLVYASLSAYGQDGPLGHRPAYDHIIQGMVGIMYTTGTPDTVPNKVGSPYVDYATGLMGAFAAVAAVMERDRTGQGQRVDVAMLDTAMLLMASLAVATAASGTAPAPTGNEAFSGAPSSGTYATTDGIVMLAANTERQFKLLCEAIGRADLLDDARFAAPAARRDHVDELRAAFTAVFATRGAAEWEEILDRAGVPGVRVRRMDEVLAEPQLAARGLLQPIALDGVARDVAVPSLGFKANGQTVAPSAPPPRLGADTDAVLGELGLDLDALRAAGAI